MDRNDQTGVRGRVLIVGILGVAVLAASFAWWHQKSRGQKAIQYWGASSAYLIRNADCVWLCPLNRRKHAVEGSEQGDVSGSEKILMDGVEWDIAWRRDISRARGLIHARQALIEDASFDWDRETPSVDPVWHYLIEFQEGERAMRIVFDKEEHWIGAVDQGRPQRLNVGAGLRKFLKEQTRLD